MKQFSFIEKLQPIEKTLKDESVMLATYLQQKIKKVHEGLEIIGLLEALAHFE